MIFTENVKKRIETIIEGNPSAFRVCISMHEEFPDGLELLEASGLRGSEIWVAYKYLGDETPGTLYWNLQNPDFAKIVKK